VIECTETPVLRVRLVVGEEVGFEFGGIDVAGGLPEDGLEGAFVHFAMEGNDEGLRVAVGGEAAEFGVAAADMEAGEAEEAEDGFDVGAGEGAKAGHQAARSSSRVATTTGWGAS
jgi:hypothetical protein